MPDLKLSKLPDRSPVRLTITLWPELNVNLRAYADFYKESYGEEESVTELIPFMLQNFLDGDRNFVRAMKESEQPTSARTTARTKSDSATN